MNEKSNATMKNDREVIVAQLMQIVGIAEKTAIALYEIGIRSYTDLIEYLSEDTAEEISEALGDHGVKRPAALIKKENWATQAMKLSQRNNTARVKSEKETKATKKSENALRLTDSSEHDAVFTVFFDLLTDEDGEQVLQTTVYDEKNSGKEEVFKGFDTAPWVNWIIGRARLPANETIISNSVEIATEFEVAPTLTPMMPGIEISEVQLSEIPTPPDVWKKKLGVEIQFQLIGVEAETLTEDQIPFRVEVYTVDLPSRTSNLVASEKGKLKPQIFQYTSQAEFTMPDIGHYELSTIVVLLPPGGLIGNYRGPVFKVVL